MSTKIKLLDSIIKVSERASSIGAIERIESSPLWIEENGVNFMVSVASALSKRPFNFDKSSTSCTIPLESNNNNIIQEAPKPLEKKKDFIDPFLPCDKDLFVCDLFGTHNLVLNKFNVSNHHSIIATIDYQSQIDPLTIADFKSIWKCIDECEMLCFFNCGPNSGASQPHKHVQLLRTPYFENSHQLKCPIESLVKQQIKKDNLQHDQVTTIESLEFQNALVTIDTDKIQRLNDLDRSIYFESIYINMLQYLNLINYDNSNNNNNNNNENGNSNNNNNKNSVITRPYNTGGNSYNFIMTNSWMFMVPRQCYQSKGISINSVGFTGAILVKREEELETIKQNGIMNLLKEVSILKTVK